MYCVCCSFEYIFLPFFFFFVFLIDYQKSLQFLVVAISIRNLSNQILFPINISDITCYFFVMSLYPNKITLINTYICYLVNYVSFLNYLFHCYRSFHLFISTTYSSISSTYVTSSCSL